MKVYEWVPQLNSYMLVYAVIELYDFPLQVDMISKLIQILNKKEGNEH